MNRKALDGLAALAFVMIVANVALPLVEYARLRARAAEVVKDVRKVRDAALAAQRGTGAWPPEAPAGRPPAELAAELDGAVSLRRGALVYDWENWSLQGGSSLYPSRGVTVGLSLRTTDERLVQMLERLWGTPLPRRGGGVTFPFE